MPISFFVYFFGLRWRLPLYPEFLRYNTMILQRPRIIVGDAGFYPGTSVSEVWRATKEPPHLQMPIFIQILQRYANAYLHEISYTTENDEKK